MRARLLVLPAALALLAAAPAGVDGQRARLKAANAGARAAEARAAALEREAAAERDAARRAKVAEAAVAARIRAAEAAVAAGEARVAITDRLLAAERARLAERQRPVLDLVAALQSLARRPAALAIARPGSTRDIVHVRAMLGTIAPEVAARAAEVRREVARVAKTRGDAATAAKSLRDGHARLRAERMALVRMEGEHRLRSRDLGRSALFESDRAIALGERAREIVDLMASTEIDEATGAALAGLPGPLPRPAEVAGTAATPEVRFAVPPYRLPAAGRVVEGLGELSSSGVRARGIAVATRAGAPVVAPAAGRVLFARRFRGYGTVVILDHGEGWSSALTGLGGAAIAVGARVGQGDVIGRAGEGEAPRVTVELRRRGVPVDLAQLLS